MIKKKEIVVALLGLSGSGKTTFYNKINHSAKIPIAPTAKYNHSTFDFSGKRISFWDCGGSADAQKNSWDNAFGQADGVIWMVDLNDSNNYSASLEALLGVVSKLHERVPILILGNKSDLVKGNASDFKDKFSTIENGRIEIISASNEKNTKEAFKRLLSDIKDAKKRKKQAEEDLKELQENNLMSAHAYRHKHDRDD